MFKKIIVAVDGSRLSMEAAKRAMELAEKFKSKIKAVYVIDQRVFYQPHDIIVLPPENPYFKILEDLQKAAAQVLSTLEKSAGQKKTSVETEVLEGSVIDMIIESIDKYSADLLVIGAHGERRKQRGTLGSTAQALSVNCPCSLLIIRD